MKNYFICFIASLVVISIMNCDDASIAFPGNYKDLDQKNPINGSVNWYEGYVGEQGKGKVDENSQSGVPLGSVSYTHLRAHETLRYLGWRGVG